MANSKTTHAEYHVIDVIIVLISIVITELISCLFSQNSKPSTQNLGSNDLQSSSTTASTSGRRKNPSPSQSTRLSKDTVALKKAAGGSTKGFPERTYCIFSKKQAIKTFIEACEEYEVWDQPSLGLSTTDYNWEVSFASAAAKHYPEERPYYC